MDSNRSPLFAAIVGVNGAGKTSFVNRYWQNQSPLALMPPVHDLVPHDIVIKGFGPQVHVYEIALPLPETSLQRNMLRRVHLMFFIFAVNDRDSFARLQLDIDSFKSTSRVNAVHVLVASKIDLEGAISEEEMSTFAANNDLLFYRVSSKTGEGITGAVESAVEEALSSCVAKNKPFILTGDIPNDEPCYPCAGC